MTVMGIDEVGRGCWAGPLVAGAVILPADFVIPPKAAWRLGDSKTLSKRQRQLADTGIRGLALAIGLGWVSSAEVDQLGLTEAVRLAMRRAAAEATTGDITTERVIIDGSINYLADMPHTEAIVKADGSVAAVSAASIVAKVARDTWMAGDATRLFPGYGFEQHVGYGTRQHQAALERLGICELHRRSFRPVAAYATQAYTDHV